MKKLLTIAAIASLAVIGSAQAIEVTSVTSSINGTIKTEGSSITDSYSGKIGQKVIELNSGLSSAEEKYLKYGSSTTTTSNKSSGTFVGGSTKQIVGNTATGTSWETQHMSGVSTTDMSGSSTYMMYGKEVSISSNGEVQDQNVYGAYETTLVGESSKVKYNSVVDTNSYFAE